MIGFIEVVHSHSFSCRSTLMRSAGRYFLLIGRDDGYRYSGALRGEYYERFGDDRPEYINEATQPVWLYASHNMYALAKRYL